MQFNDIFCFIFITQWQSFRGSSLSPVPIPVFGPHELFGQTLLDGVFCRAYEVSSFLLMSSAIKMKDIKLDTIYI